MKALVAELSQPWGDEGGFESCVHIADDPSWAGPTPGEVLAEAGRDENLSVVFFADGVAMRSAHRALPAMDLVGTEDLGPVYRQGAVGSPPPLGFRTVPSGVHDIHANLAIADMDFAEFADMAAADPEHVYRPRRAERFASRRHAHTRTWTADSAMLPPPAPSATRHTRKPMLRQSIGQYSHGPHRAPGPVQDGWVRPSGRRDMPVPLFSWTWRLAPRTSHLMGTCSGRGTGWPDTPSAPVAEHDGCARRERIRRMPGFRHSPDCGRASSVRRRGARACPRPCPGGAAATGRSRPADR